MLPHCLCNRGRCNCFFGRILWLGCHPRFGFFSQLAVVFRLRLSLGFFSQLAVVFRLRASLDFFGQPALLLGLRLDFFGQPALLVKFGGAALSCCRTKP